MHAMFGVVCFPELGRDTGRCETQIVVLSIVHETQTQNYNVTFFVRSQHENKQTKVSDSKTGTYTLFQKLRTSTVVEWLKSTTDNWIVAGSSPVGFDATKFSFGQISFTGSARLRALVSAWASESLLTFESRVFLSLRL